MNVTVNHEPDKHRFVILEEGMECVLEYRIISDKHWNMYHTYVPQELRGRQLAEKITTTALQYARDHQIKVTPGCPYVARFISLHPEYAELIK